MTNYEKIALTIDKEITELSIQYDRKERKWLLSSQEEIEAVQSKIRELKHKKTIAWEQMIVETKHEVTPAILLRMLTPIVRRRNWLIGDLKEAVDSGDGSRFPFPTSIKEPSFQPKHLKGFWSCPGCMLNMDNQELTDYPEYRKQLSWCPQFLPTLAQEKNPDEYKAFIHKLNPDAPYCYAGLLHTELQTSPTEIKLVKYCDSCSYTSAESKLLAMPIDPDKLEIGLDPASTGSQDYSTIICKCNVCGELIFEEDASKAVTPDGKELFPSYEKMLDDHYKEKH